MEKKHRAIWLLFDRILAQDIFRQAVILIVILAAVLIASFVLLSLSGADWITYCNENNISIRAEHFVQTIRRIQVITTQSLPHVKRRRVGHTADGPAGKRAVPHE